MCDGGSEGCSQTEVGYGQGEVRVQGCDRAEAVCVCECGVGVWRGAHGLSLGSGG